MSRYKVTPWFSPCIHTVTDQTRITCVILSPTTRNSEKIHERLPYTAIEVIWSARYEMARTVEDILARRPRALFLDARAAIEMAPKVARILAKELDKNESWQKGQVKQFTELARGYYLEE